VAGQVGVDLGEFGRVRQRPQAVREAVVGPGGEQRRAQRGPFDDGGGSRHGTVAPVGEQQRLQIGSRGTHQRGTVLHDVGHDPLVRQHDTVLGRGEPQRPDDAALQQLPAALLVDVQGGPRIGGQYALGAPGPQGGTGLRLAVRRVDGLRQDEPDDVVRVGRLQVQQLVGADDDVVRGRGHGGDRAHLPGCVTQSAEWLEPEAVVGHYRMLSRSRYGGGEQSEPGGAVRRGMIGGVGRGEGTVARRAREHVGQRAYEPLRK
jgi:hypothetical protein